MSKDGYLAIAGISLIVIGGLGLLMLLLKKIITIMLKKKKD